MPSQTSPEPACDPGGRRPPVREATPEDHPAIRRTVLAAYQQYADVLAPRVFERYLADLLDLETHARFGRLLVCEVDGRVVGFAAFYPDVSVQGFGWPQGWAGGRGLAVLPGARSHGVAQALVAECERLARATGAPVFAFHTAPFMSRAVALYDRLGYRRAPQHDIDLVARLGATGQPQLAIAYLRDLTGPETTPFHEPGRESGPLSTHPSARLQTTTTRSPR